MNLIYNSIDKGISPSIMGHIYSEIQKDKDIGIADELPDGRLSHIVLKGSDIPIGYVGDDSLELVYDNDIRYSFPEFTGHKRIIEIYLRAIWKDFILKINGPN